DISHVSGSLWRYDHPVSPPYRDGLLDQLDGPPIFGPVPVVLRLTHERAREAGVIPGRLAHVCRLGQHRADPAARTQVDVRSPKVEANMDRVLRPAFGLVSLVEPAQRLLGVPPRAAMRGMLVGAHSRLAEIGERLVPHFAFAKVLTDHGHVGLEIRGA